MIKVSRKKNALCITYHSRLNETVSCSASAEPRQAQALGSSQARLTPLIDINYLWTSMDYWHRAIKGIVDGPWMVRDDR
jgi:hypothetical protein